MVINKSFKLNIVNKTDIELPPENQLSEEK